MAKRHFKNLDGLRFIAATTVAIAHLEVTKRNYNLPFIKNRFVENSAQTAVTFFFVLSGFLIMWWFLEETDGRTREINIKSFYLNRVFRTWPLYFFIVILSLLINLITGTFEIDPLAPKRFIAYLLFLPNLADAIFNPDVYLGQTWSLAVEEFFYLFFPVFLLKVSERNLIKYILIVLAGSVAFSTLFNPIFFHLFFKNSYFNHIAYFIRFFERYRIYCFLTGSCVAYKLFFYQWSFSKKSLNKLAILQAFVCLTLLLLFVYGITFSFLTHQIYSILFAVFIYLSVITNKSNLLLNNKIIIIFGKISYGIYMLHMFLVIWLVNHYSLVEKIVKKSNSFVISWLLLLILVLVISYISYKLFENPIRIAARKWLLAKTQKKET